MLRSLGSVGTDFKLLTAATCQTKQAVWQFSQSYIILQFHPLVCYDRSSLCYPVPLQTRMIIQCHNSNSKTLLQYRCRQFMNAAMQKQNKQMQRNATNIINQPHRRRPDIVGVRIHHKRCRPQQHLQT